MPSALSAVAQREAVLDHISPALDNPSPSECADRIITNHALIAFGAGFVPLPLIFEMAAVTCLEINMIAALAKAYDYPVPHRLVIGKILVSILGGLGPAYISAKFNSAVSHLPLIGQIAYFSMLSVTGAASVYAVGKVFQKHFESGGTFLNSGRSVLRAYFREQQKEGRAVLSKPGRAAADAPRLFLVKKPA